MAIANEQKEIIETKRVFDSTSATDYKTSLNAELKEMRDSELWQAGAAVCKLRPSR